MAQVARAGRGRYCSPPGYGYIMHERADAAIALGDQIIETATGVAKAAAGATSAHGMAISAAVAGEQVDYIKQGEVSGFTGLVRGAQLYPSATVAGGLQTDVVANAAVQVRANNDTSVFVNYV